MLSTFINLTFVIKIVRFCLFKWPLKTCFYVVKTPILAASSCTHMRICVHIGTPLVSVPSYDTEVFVMKTL